MKAPVGPPSGYSHHMISAGSNRGAYDPKLTLSQIREFKKVAAPAPQTSFQNLKAAAKGESTANRSMQHLAPSHVMSKRLYKQPLPSQSLKGAMQ